MKRAPAETLKGLVFGLGYFVVIPGIMAISGFIHLEDIEESSFILTSWEVSSTLTQLSRFWLSI